MTNESDLVPELTPEACNAAVSLLPQQGSPEYIAWCVHVLASDAIVMAMKRNHSIDAAERQRKSFDILRGNTVPFIEDKLLFGGPGPMWVTENALNEFYAAAHSGWRGAERHVLEYAYRSAYETCRDDVLEKFVREPERLKAWGFEGLELEH